jgi:hypothetical protein
MQIMVREPNEMKVVRGVTVEGLKMVVLDDIK